MKWPSHHVNVIRNRKVILVWNSPRCEFSLVNTPLLLPYLIAAAVSEPEANERGSSLIDKNYIIAAFNHFFLPDARNCRYARMKDLGCAMDSRLSAIWWYFIRRTYFDNSGLRSRLQSCKISSESDQQSKSTANCRNNGGNPTTEVCQQFFIFLRSLFSLLCSLSALRNIVLGKPFGDFPFRTKMGLNILDFSELLVESLRSCPLRLFKCHFYHQRGLLPSNSSA